VRLHPESPQRVVEFGDAMFLGRPGRNWLGGESLFRLGVAMARRMAGCSVLRSVSKKLLRWLAPVVLSEDGGERVDVDYLEYRRSVLTKTSASANLIAFRWHGVALHYNQLNFIRFFNI
jgi:hypothetical protein